MYIKGKYYKKIIKISLKKFVTLILYETNISSLLQIVGHQRKKRSKVEKENMMIMAKESIKDIVNEP